jgi:outer membrane biosynthesis protein TonB
MAGGGRTYYATGAGRFSKGSEIRADQSGVAEATRKGELRIKTSFGTTTKAPTGTMSKEQLTKVLRSGDTVKFGDGTSVKITAANKVATINRLVSEGQRQITPAPARTTPIVGGQNRGQPTPAQKPAPATPKPAPRGQPKPASKPASKPTPKQTPKSAPRPTPKSAPRGQPKPAPKNAPKPTTPSKKGGNSGGKKNPATAPVKKGGKDGGRTRGSGSKKASGLIAGAGVINTGNRRKGGGGKKDRAKGKAKPRRKGGRSGRGRKK